MTSNGLEECIGRAIEFLRRSQLPSGEFKLYMSPDLNLERDCHFDSSVFAAALIAYSLGFADPGASGDILDKALSFLLSEMAGPGLWRYWTKRHQTHLTSPPDLDDTACVSYVLRQHRITFPPNLKLIFANRNREGLFYTWVTARWPLPPLASYRRVVLGQWRHPLRLYYFWKLEPARYDVDCIVNANVLFYVGEGPETRPVIDYLIDVLRRGEEGRCDGWYANPFMLYYAVSRNFHAGISAFGEVRDESVGRIIGAAKADGSIGDGVLNTALAVCALLNWGSLPPELERAVHFLLTRQQADGAWPRAAVYYSGPEKNYGFGSEELVTGFCLEALLRYRGASS